MSDLTTQYLEAFRADPHLPGEPRWLSARRDAAVRRFAQIGMPNRRQEGWRFSDLRSITDHYLRPLPAGTQVPPPPGLGHSRDPAFAARIVFVNGHYAAGLSDLQGLPDGIWMGSIADAIQKRPDLLEAAFDESEILGRQPLSSLNAALFRDGFLIAVDPGATISAPIEILCHNDSGADFASHLRNAVLLGEGSSVTLLERHVGDGLGWSNNVTGLQIGARGHLSHVVVQDIGDESSCHGLIRVGLSDSARYDNFLLAMGGRAGRQDLLVSANGEGAQFAVNGVALLRGSQEFTFAPRVDHRALHCTTHELFKAVVDDRAHAVFLGTIAVHPGADGTDANQLNRTLLLSDGATVDSKPELEIYADDVKCSHGATVGNLDPASLFYLMARGIAEPLARQMLMQAFVQDVIDQAPLSPHVLALLGQWTQGWLGSDSDRGSSC